MAQTFDLSDVILGALDARLDSVYTAMPGIVQSYDAEIQAVDVQPAVKVHYKDETGEDQVEALPIIPVVPVVFPGGGGFRVTFPIKKGDSCLLVFMNSSIDRWLKRGGVVDPQDERRHTINDAVAIVGLKDFGHALSSAPTNRMSMGKDGGPTIEIDGSNVKLGGNDASESLAYKSALESLKQVFIDWNPTPNDGGLALKNKLVDPTTGLFINWPTGTSVTKAK